MTASAIGCLLIKLAGESPFLCRASSMCGQAPNVAEVLAFVGKSAGLNQISNPKQRPVLVVIVQNHLVQVLRATAVFGHVQEISSPFPFTYNWHASKGATIGPRGCKVSCCKSGTEIRRYLVAIVSQTARQ